MIKYDELLSDKNHRWIHLESPDRKEIERMKNNYGIPRDFISDMYDPFEVARSEYLEKDEQHAKLLLIEHVQLRNNHTQDEEFVTLPLSIILVENRIITVSRQTPDFLEKIYKKYFTSSKAKIKDIQEFLLLILHENEKYFIGALRRIFGKIERMRIDVQHSSGNKELYRQIAIEKSIIILRDGIKSNRSVIETFQEYPLIPPTNEHLNKMHDVLVDSRQAEQMAQTCSNLADHLSSLFDNVISNNLNTIMKTLTSITIILTIPTIVGGLWGMNVRLPIENHPQAFSISLLFIILLSLLAYWWLKKNDYF
ncbi:MAG: magnesium transporter CorA family protein [Atopococcus tabaci]|uniref:Magnesium transporter CorA family protein n=1 Tax=Atopococcus tabaci TaxID=269774 RepID=A0AA43UA81_9LACT|nr:magnesium transporter CorA family protein [Atopococcus tabaci]